MSLGLVRAGPANAAAMESGFSHRLSHPIGWMMGLITERHLRAASPGSISEQHHHATGPPGQGRHPPTYGFPHLRADQVVGMLGFQVFFI